MFDFGLLKYIKKLITPAGEQKTPEQLRQDFIKTPHSDEDIREYLEKLKALKS